MIFITTVKVVKIYRFIRGNVSMSVTYKAIDSYDVTNLIGLRAIVVNAAQEVEENGEISIEVPDIEALAKAAVMARCLIPISLTSKELKNIRKIVGWSASELAEKMGDKTNVATVSRWENDRQNMGGYAEKVFRLIVCEYLKNDCPGVNYECKYIAELRIISIDRIKNESSSNIEIPHIKFDRIKVKVCNKSSVDAWENELLLAA